MAVYAIGDIQGCYDSLQRLLDSFGFDATTDRLWLVGDLVNRGPKSVDVLRWARALGDRVTAVLGNHDVHLLGAAVGVRKQKKLDTLGEVLAAPDRDELIHWLRTRPLLHRDGDTVMVHAGLHPDWTIDEASALAGEVQARLRGDDWAGLVASSYDRKTPAWSPALTGTKRLCSILAVLIRIRACKPDGRLNKKFVGPPEQIPDGFVPWFDAPTTRSPDCRIVFGHWSSLGLRVEPGYLALDTGCVWGGQLTAVRLDDGAVFQQHAVD